MAPKKKTDWKYRPYANSQEHLIALLKARVPIIYVRTSEETRFIESIKDIESDLDREIFVWSSYQGLMRNWNKEIVPRAKGKEEKTYLPEQALTRIIEHKLAEDFKNRSGIIYIMRDMNKVMNEKITRQLRDMYEHLIHGKKTIIIVAPQITHGRSPGLEPTMEKQIVVVDYELPNHTEILECIKDDIKYLKKENPEAVKRGSVKLDYTGQDLDELARACQGLTMQEIETAIAASLTTLGHINIEFLHQEKKHIINKTDILEFYDDCPGVDEVGGMDKAKEFFENYKNAWTPEARAYGVEPLKGVLLTGVPGTGKSLLAKALAKQWALPIVRMDVGRIMTGIVGGSESRMREGIALAEAISPCILWIDEIEKALSGTKSSNFSDGGTLSRVFGTLLTSMQEGLKNVTIVATANDINALPPELIRRFDEVFFVDLPTADEREEIFKIHLKKRKRDPNAFNLTEAVNASVDYTGAEIEKVIKDSIAKAWTDGNREMNAKDLVATVKETRPLSIVMAEQINKIRAWARDRARYASSGAEERNKPGNQKIIASNGKAMSVDDALSDIGDIQTEVEEVKAIEKRGKKGRGVELS